MKAIYTTELNAVEIAKTKNWQQKINDFWEQKAQAHWKRWGVWVWIVVLMFIWGQVSFFADAKAGWEAADKGEIVWNEITPWYEYIIPTFFGISFGFMFLLLPSLIVGLLHYRFIYKPIFKSYRISNIIIYVLVCVLVYDYFLADFLFAKIDSLKKENNENDLWALFTWTVSLMFSIIYDFRNNEEVRQKLEQERNLAEIQALKAQINPHFLFNTLNNLYGTAIVEDSPQTAEGIHQLAGIMRHAVESSKHESVEIEKEISFLRDYIEIQQLRLPKRENIRIVTDIEWDEKAAFIAPLILMTFAENAFKYGLSIEQECFLELKLKVENQQLTFVCRNSVVPRTQIEKGTGMGIENTVRRLRLLYPNRHSIQINQNDTVFEVFLTINLPAA
ncbi:MAG: histidine kinase [Runella slithyformis]|nr:MAG: histidine kinase [Runella slithyformis]TAF25321.1 MAG: histidine kinase [Runella slithyformis]TAF43665.1 MAG: histidine kinase [Runella slithyformis]TAF78995.1 MAG: histidine kinase [Runella slithyformis]